MNDASTAALPPAMSDWLEVIAKVTSELAAIANDVGLGAPHREVPLAIVQLIAPTPLTRNATTVAVVTFTGLKPRSMTLADERRRSRARDVLE